MSACGDTYLCVVLVDVLVVSHLHQAMAQVVVGEDEETGLKVAVDFFKILQKIVMVNKWEIKPSEDGVTLHQHCH